ncbi:MAG: TetR/AcrR family transcriptional regulator [Cyanobacteria bacterium J06600_6]
MKTKAYHHGNLRQQIINEALTWIEQENIVSLSLRGIAKRIGVSHNAPYRHFSDKESLLVKISEIGYGQLFDALKEAAKNSPNNSQQQLENIGVAYIQYAVDHRAYYRVMFGDRQLICKKHPELYRLSQESFNILLDCIKTGQERQIFIQQDSLQLARICWSLTHGVSMLAINNQLDLNQEDELLKLAQMATKITSQGLIQTST